MHRKHLKRVALLTCLVVTAGSLLTGCGTEYMLPEEYLTDGEILSASMDKAALKVIDIPFIDSENAPYALTNLDIDDEDHLYLHNRFEDVLSENLSTNGITAVPQGEVGNYEIKFRLIECQVVNKKAPRGRVIRVGRTTAHLRIYDPAGEMVWAGEVWGEYDNDVPSNVVSKLIDERIIQIKPQAIEKGENPFIEPILVTGITGALIYLFSISAE